MTINRQTAAPTFIPGGIFNPSSFGALYESIYLNEKDAIDKDKDDDDDASEDEVNDAFKKHLKSKHKKSSCDDDDDDKDETKDVKEDFEDYLNYLHDDELEEIVDETIGLMYEEGYDLDEIEEAFDEYLEEATVTMGRGGMTSGSGSRVTTGSGTDMRKKAKRAAVVSAARQRQAQAVKDAPGKAVGRVRDAVKSGVDRARSTVDNAAGDYAAKNKVITSKKGRALNRSAIALKQRSKDPSGRRSVRSAVVGHLVNRAKDKIGDGLNKVKSTATSAATAAVSKAKAAGASAKKAGKGFIGKAARKVASGAGNLASRLGEEYEVVVDYLMEEGFVDNIVSAEVFVNHMSEEWVESILEEVYE